MTPRRGPVTFLNLRMILRDAYISGQSSGTGSFGGCGTFHLGPGLFLAVAHSMGNISLPMSSMKIYPLHTCKGVHMHR